MIISHLIALFLIVVAPVWGHYETKRLKVGGARVKVQSYWKTIGWLWVAALLAVAAVGWGNLFTIRAAAGEAGWVAREAGHGEFFEALAAAFVVGLLLPAVYRTLDDVARCICGARLRPHIVFFGEIPLEMTRIQSEIDRATLMLVVGTSGSVYPAANFVHWARQHAARTIYVGPEPPLNAPAFTHVIEGPAGEVLPTLFAA